LGSSCSICNRASTEACAWTAAIGDEDRASDEPQCHLGGCSKQDRLLHPPDLRAGSSASSSFVLFVSFVVKQSCTSIPKSKLDHRPVGRLIAMGKQRNRSVLVSDTVIIISYHEISTLDRQSHSCYDKRDEKVRA
jgi:hypothetical protein